MFPAVESLLPHSSRNPRLGPSINRSTPSLPLFSSSTISIKSKTQRHGNWRNRRINRSLLVYLFILLTTFFIYARYLHRFIFIDYSAFSPPTGLAIIHPGTDPEPSVPHFHLEDLLLTANTTQSQVHTRLHEDLLIDLALQEISRRFQSVWIKPSSLSCKPSNETQNLINTRFLDTNGKPNGHHKVMIALNLHSSQPVLPALTNAILNTLRYIGIDNVFLSIYENGSWDHTPEGLAHLGAVLTGLGVGHRIRHAKEETSWAGVDRIKILSSYRNIALSAVEEAELRLNGLSELIFINDVFLCAQDILEVIWERNFQNADASCGTDWKESSKFSDRMGWGQKQNKEEGEDISSENKKKVDLNKSVVLYDSWVARSLSGNTLRPRLDFFTDFRDGYSVLFSREESQVYRARFQNTLAVPVYSCWNGIISLNPTPFKSPLNVKFRAGDRANGECPSSECQLLAKDFWSLGFNKWILVPKVAVTYTQDTYYSHDIVNGSNRDHLTRPQELSYLNQKDPNYLGFFGLLYHPDQDNEYYNEKIDWSKYKKPETVVCWPDMHSFHLDFEWNHVLESPYNPKLINWTSTNNKNLEFF